MTCEAYRNALSARIDGEGLGMTARELDAHLATCAGCRQWAALADRLSRVFRLAPAEAVPDLSVQVVAALEGVGPIERRQRRLAALRAALAVVAAAQLGLTLWTGMAGGLFGTPLHVDREAVAWNLALAAGLFAVVWQVRRVAGVLPLLGALVTVMFVFEVLDLARGHARLAAFLPHLLLVMALVLLVLLSAVAQPSGGEDVRNLTVPAGPVGVPGTADFPRSAAPAGGPAAVLMRRSVA